MSLKWKEAATVILTSLNNKRGISAFNYDLLSIKRSAKNSFMPGTHVFPGGASHPADRSEKWLEIFKKFNLKYDSKLNDAVTPPALMDNEGKFPKVASLKVTAIRETFEETGILLCKKKMGNSEWISSVSVEDSDMWRKNVENDAYKFLNLCEHFNCCPDITSLHLWSNWLTPRTKSKRFDTIFFTASLSEMPLSVADENEIDELTWLSPRKLLEHNEQDLLVLPPPQLYEISRLIHFTDCSELVSYAKKRALQGCERWMPQYVQTKDGLVSLLPGDDAYQEGTCDGLNLPVPVINMTRSEFKSQSQTLHRFEGKKILTKNYNPKNGHLLPVVSLF